MSIGKNKKEAQRWIETGREDLAAAKLMAANKMYSHACFLAQQCGEKAVKALWFLIGQDPRGHSIQKMVSDFPRHDIMPEIRKWSEKGALLDRYYIPTRYPNGLPDLTPGVSYFRQDAAKAIRVSECFLSAVENIIAAGAKKTGKSR